MLKEILDAMDGKFGVEATGKKEFDTKGIQVLFEGIPHPLKGIPSAIRVVANGMKMLAKLKQLENIIFLRKGLGLTQIMSAYEDGIATETFNALSGANSKFTDKEILDVLPKESPFVEALTILSEEDKDNIDNRIFLDMNVYARLKETWLDDLNKLREASGLNPAVLLITNVSIRNCDVDDDMPSKNPHTEIGDIPSLTHLLIAFRETANLTVPLTDILMLAPSQQIPDGYERIGAVPNSKNSLVAARGPKGIMELVLSYGEPPEGYHVIQLPKSAKKDFMGRVFLCWLLLGEELPVPPTEEELRLLEEQKIEEQRKELLRQRSQQLAELEYNIQASRERNAALQLEISRVIRDQDESKERDEDKHPVEMQVCMYVCMHVVTRD